MLQHHEWLGVTIAMFTFLRKKAKASSLTLPGAAQMEDGALINAVLRTFQNQSPVVAALFLVACENLPVYFPLFQGTMEEQKLFAATYEGMSAFFACQYEKHPSSSEQDEVARRRFFYFYVACLLQVAHQRAATRTDLRDQLADVWLALIPGARSLRATLDRTALWGPEETDFFVRVRTEDDGEHHLLRFIMPEYLRCHPKVVAWEERNLSPEDRAQIEEAMQLFRGKPGTASNSGDG